MQHNPGASVHPKSYSLLPTISGDTVLANPTPAPSVSFANCQPPLTSLEANLIGDITATPHIETHVDPPPLLNRLHLNCLHPIPLLTPMITLSGP